MLLPASFAHEQYNVYPLEWLPEADMSPGTVDFSCTVAGHFRGLAHPLDVAILEGGRLWTLQAPGQQHILARASELSPVRSYSALDIEPALSPGAADRAIVSHEDGLTAFEWDETLSRLSPAHSLSQHALVRNACEIQVTVLPSGQHALSGLASDGLTFFYGFLSGTAFSVVSSFPAAGPVLDWKVIQWDGVGDPEFAVRTQAGVSIRTPDGSDLFGGPFSVPAPTPELGVFFDPDLGSDRLVFSTFSATPGQHRVQVVDRRLPQIEPPIEVGAILPGSFTTGEWSSDLAPDLFIYDEVNRSVAILPPPASIQFPESQSFDGANPNWKSIGYQSVGDPGLMIVADFDVDGDDDLFGTEDGNGSIMHRGLLQDGVRLMVDGPTEENDVALSYGVVLTEVQLPSGAVTYVAELSTLVEVQFEGGPEESGTECRVEVFVAGGYGVWLPSPEPTAVGTVAMEDGTATVAWSIEETYANEEVIQVRLTPMTQGFQTGPAKTVELRLYQERPEPIPGTLVDLPFYKLGNGGGASGSPGYPPKPKVGPSCADC